jgi:hypothetical protein
MANVTLDLEYDDYKLRARPIETNSDQIKISDLSETEGARIQRTAHSAADSIAFTQTPRANGSLDNAKLSEIPSNAPRVTEAAQSTGLMQVPDDVQATIDSIVAHREILADEAIPIPADVDARLTELLGPNATVVEKKGLLIQINELIADIMKLISKMNDRDRQKNDHLKIKYEELTNTIGDSISKKGTTNFYASIGSFICCAAGLIIGMKTDYKNIQAGMDILGKQIPGFAGLLTTSYDVEQNKSTNRLSLVSNDMQNTSQKSGDNSGWKNELTQALNDIRQWMTAAARSN